MRNNTKLKKILEVFDITLSLENGMIQGEMKDKFDESKITVNGNNLTQLTSSAYNKLMKLSNPRTYPNETANT